MNAKLIIPIALLVSAWGLNGGPIACCQDLIIRGDVQIIQGRRIAVINDLAQDRRQAEASSSDTLLKVDPELESILQKAERYQEDGNYTVACQLWQIVLERSGDTLFTTDGQTYFSMVEQVERILAALPEEGLRTYRITADAQARQVMAQASSADDRQALSEVVRKYFVSSIGDEAAFRLACLDLDQHDFVGALRLLTKIRDLHPDPTLSDEELLPRIALCQAMIGNLDDARQTIEQLPARARGARVAGGMAEQLVAAMEQGRETGFGRMQSDAFLAFRRAPDVPAAMRQGRLYSAWQFFLEPPKDGSTVFQSADAVGRILELTPDTMATAANTVASSERNLIDAWINKGWRPAGELQLREGLVVYRTPANVTAWPAEGGQRATWRSVWLNQFELDDATRQLQNLQRAYGGRTGLSGRAAREGMDSEASVQLYGD
ncbi:MAG TPA: tetratricopeptide repeat protein, partial [Pirellulaceae bacterium]|nr:tetratricopeptide repeat protein [Pirellulaceae bacterium]